MNEDLQQLQASLAAMRAELDDTKARLAKLETVISFDEGSDGKEEAYIDCADLVVRQRSDRRYLAVHLGSTEIGGYMDVHYTGEEHAIKTAIRLGIDDDGEPHMQLLGKDWKMRADIFIDKDHGTMAVLAPANAPGAVMRAHPGGGSVAVLQPDGKARAVLIHDEFHKNAGSDEASPSTDLLFATAEAKMVLKLHGNAEGGLMCVGHPGQPDAAVLMSRKDGATLMLNSPTNKTSVSLAAMDGMARIAAHEGMAHAKKAEACLVAGTFGSCAELRDCDGTKRVDIHAAAKAGTIHLLDDGGKEAVALSHFADSHSSLAMKGVSEHDCVRLIANKDLAALRITSPGSEDTAFVTTAQEDKAMVFLTKDKLPRVMLSEGELGGMVCAYGPEPEKAGCATLAGGPITGSLSLSMTDGTAQLTLDGTDHGGRLMINNDLGFQRIAMGVYQESAGLHMNHTGSPGVQAVATPEGGLLAVCNAEGKVIDSMPKHDDDEDDSDRWGKLPGSE